MLSKLQKHAKPVLKMLPFLKNTKKFEYPLSSIVIWSLHMRQGHEETWENKWILYGSAHVTNASLNVYQFTDPTTMTRMAVNLHSVSLHYPLVRGTHWILVISTLHWGHTNLTYVCLKQIKVFCWLPLIICNIISWL